ncbi:Ig-like domain-containing protein, partial [Aquabacterium lacunae]
TVDLLVNGQKVATLTVVSEDGRVTIDPVANYVGPLNFTYTVSDGTTTDVANVNVTVDSVNDAPVARNDVVGGDEDTPFSFDPRANDTDPENNPLTILTVNGQPISV